MYIIYELKIKKLNDDNFHEYEIILFNNINSALEHAYKEVIKINPEVKYSTNGEYIQYCGNFDDVIKFQSIINLKKMDVEEKMFFYASF